MPLTDSSPPPAFAPSRLLSGQHELQTLLDDHDWLGRRVAYLEGANDALKGELTETQRLLLSKEDDNLALRNGTAEIVAQFISARAILVTILEGIDAVIQKQNTRMNPIHELPADMQPKGEQ